MMPRAANPCLPLRAFVRAFRADRHGAAAIEFALIAPVLIALLVVTFEGGRAYSIYRHVGNTADMIGDLVAREIKVRNIAVEGDTTTGMDKIYNLVPAAMDHHVVSNLKIQVIPIFADGPQKDQIRVYAKPPGSGTASHACSNYAADPDEKTLLQSGIVGLIIVKATYVYKPYLLGGTEVPFEYKQMYVPRRAACVAFDTYCGAAPAACDFRS